MFALPRGLVSSQLGSGRLAQNVIFLGCPGDCRPVFPYSFAMGRTAASTQPGTWLLSTVHKLLPLGWKALHLSYSHPKLSNKYKELCVIVHRKHQINYAVTSSIELPNRREMRFDRDQCLASILRTRLILQEAPQRSIYRYQYTIREVLKRLPKGDDIAQECH